MNVLFFFTNSLLYANAFKISLYDWVFSGSRLTILVIEYSGFSQFCSGYVSEAKQDYLHSGGLLFYQNAGEVDLGD